MRILLIINPAAGSGGVRGRLDLAEWAPDLVGHALTVVTPRTPEETEAAARRGVDEGYGLILAAGGDGTISRAASALAGSEVPLGLVPLGTVNVLARELAIPLDPLQALRVALRGQPRRIDLGVANGKSFTLMAGLGFDAQVVAEVAPRLKELFGPLAYVTAGLQVLARHRASQFHLTADGAEFDLPAWLIVVANASCYAYELAIAADARMDDGLLDVCIFAERTALDRLTQISAVMVGQHGQHANVRSLRARSLKIAADPPVAVQLDGDPAGASPVEITIRPQALSVMTPAVRSSDAAPSNAEGQDASPG